MHFLIVLHLFNIFFAISNAIPTASPSSPNFHRDSSPVTIRESGRTDLAPLGVRDIATRDVSSTIKPIFGALKLIYNNFTISLITSDQTKQLLSMYTEILSTIAQNLATDPVRYLSITFGDYKLVFSCAQAIAWTVLQDIVTELQKWLRAGLSTTAAVFNFISENLYMTMAPIVIVIAVCSLSQIFSDLFFGGGGGAGGVAGVGSLEALVDASG